MKEDNETSKNSVKENVLVVDNGKKKPKEDKPATKVVVRRLPPSMTEEEFLTQVSPLPEYDYIYFVPAETSLMNDAFCRAYINFVNQSDLFIFNEKFDGYVFVDNQGGEYPAVVEFAPFQRIPKNRPNRKKDSKMSTIVTDPVFIQFKEELEAMILENKLTNNPTKQHFFEISVDTEKKEETNTPLLDYVKNRRAERLKFREEKREERRKKDLERKRLKDEQRKTKKEDIPSVVKVLNSQSSKDRFRERDAKSSYAKKKIDDTKPYTKDKPTNDSRSKEGKVRTGKSYLEERQRQAERREERKKLSQSQSTVSDTDTKSEDKITEESTMEEKSPESETRVKDLDKKPDKSYKREEIKRNPTKFDAKRDKDTDERRYKKPLDKGDKFSRREEERYEDSGRKKYLESRRNNDVRDKYKEKEKNKFKKSLDSKMDSESVRSKGQQRNDVNNLIVENKAKESGDITEENSPIKSTDESNDSPLIKETILPESNDLIETKAVISQRRKSLDLELSSSQNLLNYSKDTDIEMCKKRRNSVDSSQNQEKPDSLIFRLEISNDKGKICEPAIEQPPIESTYQSREEDTHNKVNDKNEDESMVKVLETEDNSVVKDLETEDNSMIKRRNSTGERPNKISPRRNSLGSEDKHTICSFHSRESNDSGPPNIKDTNKEEEKQQINSQDPRTERRIRNKDRPSLEIYRPGMGKFSKQRLEREKVLGSSTEIESPSSSPSPTPVMKHKTTSSTSH